jgi:hypothetical protein
MRFVTRKTIDKYLEKVSEVREDGKPLGWQPFHVQQAIPIFPRIPALNPEGPTYLLYGDSEKELNKRQPSIDYFYLCRRAARKTSEERRLQQLVSFDNGYKTRD